MPHFKVQARVGLAAAIANRCNGVAGLDPFAHLLIQTFIITVQAHIPLAVVDDDEVSKAPQPLGKHHLTCSNCLHRNALPGPNEQPLPAYPATLSRSTKTIHEFPGNGQA